MNISQVYITYAHRPEISGLSGLFRNGSRRGSFVQTRGGSAGSRLRETLVKPGAGEGALVVNAGFAGDLASKDRAGTVALVTEFLYQGPSGYISTHTHFPPKMFSRWAFDRGLIEASCLTVASPVASDERRVSLAAASGADIVDMEAYHLLGAAADFDAPFVCLKVISDSADTTAWSDAVGGAPKWSKILDGAVEDFLGQIVWAE